MKNTPDLHHLATEIADREEAIQSLRKQATDKASETVREVLLQGQALLRVEKLLGHDMDIDNWLPANCALLELPHAHNYMRVARNPTRYQDPNQMLLAVWHENGETKPPDKTWPSWYAPLTSLAKWTRALTKAPPLNQWPEEGRSKLREELEPIAKALWPAKF